MEMPIENTALVLERLEQDLAGNAPKVLGADLARMSSGGSRYYYRIVDGEVKWYPSVTTIAGRMIPKSPAFYDWYASQGGSRNVKLYSDMRARYGSAMHEYIGSFLKNGSEWRVSIDDLIERHKPVGNPFYSEDEWREDLWHDLEAFVRFVNDYNVEWLGLELGVYSDVMHFAGSIDLLVEMDIDTVEVEEPTGEEYKRNGNGCKKGDPKMHTVKKPVRGKALIDFKSGRKGFFEEHKFQLQAYLRAANELWPELEIVACYNWAPSNKTKRKYSLRDQSTNNSYGKPKVIEGMCWTHLQLHNMRPPENIPVYPDGLKVGDEPDELVTTANLDELILTNHPLLHEL